MSRSSLAGRAVAGIVLLVVGACAPAAAPTGGSAAPAGGSAAPPAASVSASAASADGSGGAASGDPAQHTADIDIGGRTLHLFCMGTAPAGSPTVLGESGLGGDSRTWNDLFYAIAKRTRICAYDRAGTFQSPAAPEPSRTLADQVDDLEELVAAGDLAGPLILVGHSIGAWHVALFTSRHPGDVVGAVLADPRGPRVSAEWLAALPSAAADETVPVATIRDELTTFEQTPGMNDEHLDLIVAAREANAVLDPKTPLFGDRPLTVLSGGLTSQNWADLPDTLRADFGRIWHDGQAALAAESTKGSLQVVADSDHDVPAMRPDAIVDAIVAILDQLGA